MALLLKGNYNIEAATHFLCDNAIFSLGRALPNSFVDQLYLPRPQLLLAQDSSTTYSTFPYFTFETEIV
jgi:hypothetical protein